MSILTVYYIPFDHIAKQLHRHLSCLLSSIVAGRVAENMQSIAPRTMANKVSPDMPRLICHLNSISLLVLDRDFSFTGIVTKTSVGPEDGSPGSPFSNGYLISPYNSYSLTGGSSGGDPGANQPVSFHEIPLYSKDST